MMDTAREGTHDKTHWGCCWMPVGGKVLWIVGFLLFLAALIALWQGGEFGGVFYMTWYWTALVSGVLSISAKSAGHHWCETHSES